MFSFEKEWRVFEHEKSATILTGCLRIKNGEHRRKNAARVGQRFACSNCSLAVDGYRHRSIVYYSESPPYAG